MKSQTTPKGSVMWAKVMQPDKRWNPEGVYKIDLVLSGTEASDLKAQFTDLINEKKDTLEKSDIDHKSFHIHEPWDDNEDGETTFKFGSKATYSRNGATIATEISVVDSDCEEIPKDVIIWNGSTVRINYFPSPYFVGSLKKLGVKLMLNGVQVLEMAEKESGFEKEEEGFKASNIVGARNELESDGEGDF